jgi:hypothetical protein
MHELKPTTALDASMSFLIWIGVWILALAVLLPALG